MALNNPFFRPQDLSGDPALTGEIGQDASIEYMSLGQIIGAVSRSVSKPPEMIGAPDVAEFLLDQGASRGKFAQIFSPESMSQLEMGNMVPPSDVTIDPAMTGGQDAPIQDPQAGEFSRRFLNEAQQGMRRLYEQQFPDGPGVNLAEAAFPADVQREIDKQRMQQQGGGDWIPRAMEGQSELQPHIGPWEPPVLKGVFNFAANKAVEGMQAGVQSGDKAIMDIVETVEADEAETAPMWIYEQKAHKEYTDDWWWGEQKKAVEKLQGGDVVGAIASSVGAFFGWAGRTRDSLAGTMQAINGQIMANILHSNYFGWRDDDLFGFVPEDADYIEWLATGDTREDIGKDQDLARARRSFFNENARGWHWGFKGVAENWATLPLEIMMPGPKVAGPIIGPVARKIPGATTAARKMAELKAGAGRYTPGPLGFLKPLTFRQRLRAEHDTANRINALEPHIHDVLQTAYYNVPMIEEGVYDIPKVIENIETIISSTGNLKKIPHVAKNPKLMDPNGEFQELLQYFRGADSAYEDAFVEGRRVLKKDHAIAYNDLAKNGPRANKVTQAMYNSESPPPLPLDDLDFSLYKNKPRFGKDWSPDAPAIYAKHVIMRRHAESVGWGYGQQLRRFGLWGPGNTNLAKWLSDKSKKHLGYTWLFGRSGFAVLNAVGGTAMVMIKMGPAMFRYPRSQSWFNRLEESSKGAMSKDMLVGYRASVDALAGERGMHTRAVVGHNIMNEGSSLFASVPFFGDRFLPFALPDSWLDDAGRKGSMARFFNEMPGLGGGIATLTTATENIQHKFVQTIELEKTAKWNFRSMLDDLDLPEGQKNRLYRQFARGNANMFSDTGLEKYFGRLAVEESQRGRFALSPEQLAVKERGDIYGYRGMFVQDGEIPEELGFAANRSKKAAAFGRVAEKQYPGDNAVDTIFIDDALLRRRFKEKAWSKNVRFSDGSKVPGLSKNTFKSYENFRAFVLEYEFLRASGAIKQGDLSRADWELRLRSRALDRYDEVYASRTLTKNVTSALKDADSEISQMADRLADQIIERLPRAPSSLVIQDYVEDTISGLIRDSLENGKLITPEDILAAGDTQVKELTQQLDRTLKTVIANSPDGTVGKLAAENLHAFEQSKTPITELTHRTLGEMTAHDTYQQALQDQLMDLVSHRLSTFGGAQKVADEGVQGYIVKLQDEFTAVRGAKHKEVVKELAAYIGARNKIAPRGVKRSTVGKTAKQVKQDAFDINRQLEDAAVLYNGKVRDINRITGDKLQSIVARVAGDEMTELVLQAERSLARKHKRKMPVEVSPQKMAEINAASEVLGGLRERISRINTELDDLKSTPEYKEADVLIKEAMLKRQHEMRANQINKAYMEVANNDEINKLLDLKGKLGLDMPITPQMATKIHEAVDRIKNRKSLKTYLDENDPTAVLRMHGEREIEIVKTAFKVISDRWRKPVAMEASPEAVEAGLPKGLTTVDDIRRIRDASILDARRHAQAASNEALFSYIYNRPEVMMQVLTPYPYWSMKFAMFQARQVFKRPAQYRMFAELMSDWMDETEDLPDHLKMTLFVWRREDGTEILFDPKILLGGPSATTVMSLRNRGQDPDKAETAFQMVQLMNLVYAGRAHPWISLVTHEAVDYLGAERVQGLVNNPELYNELLGKYGYVPPWQEQLASLVGMNQRVATAGLAQGILGAPAMTPEVVYEQGLTGNQRIRIGHAIADMVVEGKITDQEAEQAIVDIQNSVPNPVALEGMKKYFGDEWHNLLWNWGFGGRREYRPMYKRSRELNNQYREAKSRGNFGAADQLIKENPDIPVRWMINDDPEAQELGLAKSRYWESYYQASQKRNQVLDSTGVLNKDARVQIDSTFREQVASLQKELGLSNEDINPSKGEKLIPDGEQSEPYLQNLRKESVKTLVSTFREMIRYEDFVDEKGLFDYEGYDSIREDWLKTHVPETMAVEFQSELNKNISLPEAVLSVYKKEFVAEYFAKTASMTPDEKSAYMAENQVPSLEKLIRAVKETYPDRNWVNKGEDIDPIVNDAKIRSAIERPSTVMVDGTRTSVSLSLQGFLDVSAQDKIARVRRSSIDNPYSFKTKGGNKLVTKETLGEYTQAYEDMSKFMSSLPDRKVFDGDIERLSEDLRNALDRLTPMDFALGNDDGIREKYYGKGGTSGLIGRVRNQKKQAVDRGMITEWTPLADKWFGNDKEYGKEDALREMRGLYFRVEPAGFASNEGIDWEAYNEAREQVFTEALELGEPYSITATEFRADLDKRKGASEAAWIYWQELMIGPALEERNEMRNEFGRVSAEDHGQILRKYGKSQTVREILSDVINRFPHLKTEDFYRIIETRMPSFGEYWQARGYHTPVGGQGASTRSYYSGGDKLAPLRAWMAENPGQLIDKSLVD